MAFSKSLAVFVVGMGISICLNALLGAVSYYSFEFGASNFIWMTSAVYLPGVFIALVMSFWTDKEEKACDVSARMWCDARRVVLAFTIGSVALMLIPELGKSESGVLVLGMVIGLCSATALGYGLQMVLRVSSFDKSGGNEAALSFGFQCSSLVCFIAQEITGVGPNAPHSDLALYFYINGAVSLLAVGGVVYYAMFGRSCRIKPNLFSTDQEQLNDDNLEQQLLGQEQEDQDDDYDGNREQEPLTWRQAFHESLECGLALFLAIFASTVVFPFYAFVVSSNEKQDEDDQMAQNAKLATILFYVKTFSDTLSRPATVALPSMIQTPRRLLLFSGLRLLVFVPFFFMYVFSDTIPQSDVMFCIVIGIFAASSGYIKTVSFQLAPTEGKDSLTVRRITTILNLFFQLALFVALATSLTIRFAAM